MQIFYINQNSELPTLRIELVNDGKYDFMKFEKFNNAIQGARVLFSMKDEHDVYKILKAECDVIQEVTDACQEKFIIEYKWKKRDTRNKGLFTGKFEIFFEGGIKDADYDIPTINDSGETEVISGYPAGLLIVPIYEDLKIQIL